MNFGRRGGLPRSTSTVSNASTGASTDNDSTYGNDVEDEEKDKYKRKTRNLSEKKRRDQFNILINELCSMVSANNRKMDKSTVLKSTIAFLKNYQELAMQSQAHEIKEDWKPSFLSNDEFTQLMLEALDSFLLVFTQQGNILYASESITSLLGHLPKDLVNRSFYDFIHDSERASLHKVLLSYQINNPSNNIQDFDTDESHVSFMCHIKRGTDTPEISDVYEYVKVTGNLRKWSNCEDGIRRLSKEFPSQNLNDPSCFCCTVRLQPCQFIREISNIDETMTEFTSRHSFEWKFLFLDHRAPPIIGYLPFEVLGTSGYDYYHPDDLEKLSAGHAQLMQAGEGTSCFYRFLTKGQQWIWLKTRYYITYHQWNSKPEFIVCTHKVISYADVRMHQRKEQGLDEEEIEAAPTENATAAENSFANSSICHVSPTWAIQLAAGIPGSSPAGHLRILTDRADTADKPHQMEELTLTTVFAHTQIKQKQKTKLKQQQLLTVQQQMSLPLLHPQLQSLYPSQLAQVQQQSSPPPAASSSTKFEQPQATSTQQQQQQAPQQQAQQQEQEQEQEEEQQQAQEQKAQLQQAQEQKAQLQQQQPQQQQQQQQQSPQQTPPAAASVQPTTAHPQPAPQQSQQAQTQQVAHLPVLKQSPSTADLTSHPSLTVPGGMMMMMAAPSTIPTTDLDTLQVNSDLVRIYAPNQISTVLTPGQPTLAVSGLSLPHGIAQTSTLVMTPAQRQLHKQLQYKSQQLQQTILRQQEELRQITEELALAHQFMPIADQANSGAQMLMMNPATFTSPTTTEIPSTSSTSQFNILPHPITIQQPMQQQFLPFQILPTSHGQIVRHSPISNITSLHPHQ